MTRLRLSVAAVLFATGLAFLPAQAPKGKKYALLVGINTYDKKTFVDLEYAERDAEEMAKVLQASGYEVTLLLSRSEGDKRATRANVEAALAGLLNRATKSDALVIGLAGHGLQFTPEGGTREEAFFCPRDAVKGEAGTMVNLSKLLRDLDEKGAGTNLLLVDACRDDPTPNRGTRGIDGSRIEALPEGVAILLSCSRGRKAHELAALKHGVFFHFVLEGLRGKAANARGEVDWDRLKSYVREQIEVQYPDLKQVPQDFGNLARRVVLAQRDATSGGAAASRVEPPVVEPKPAVGDRHVGSTGLVLVKVGKGTFWMGSPAGETDHQPDEKQKEVTIGHDFYIGQFEVTQGEWEALMDSNPSYFSRTGIGKNKVADISDDDLMRFPVEQVSWDDTQAFLKKLTASDTKCPRGWEYRLPTEAQWEYACRGGPLHAKQEGKKTAPFYFQTPTASLNSTQANFDVNYRGGAAKGPNLQRTCKVGSYQANALGLYDMHGNVWERCQDLSGPPDPSVRHPFRVTRGGSWGHDVRDCRAAYRYKFGATSKSNWLGFRVVLVPVGS